MSSIAKAILDIQCIMNNYSLGCNVTGIIHIWVKKKLVRPVKRHNTLSGWGSTARSLK